MIWIQDAPTMNKRDVDPIPVLTRLLEGIEYDKGELKERGDYMKAAIELENMKAYPGFVGFEELISCPMDELTKVPKIYDGKIPNSDINEIVMKINKRLMSLPEENIFLLQLPDGLELDGNITIDAEIEIIKATEQDVAQIDAKNEYTFLRRDNYLNGLLGAGDVPVKPHYSNLIPGSCYLKVISRGYVSQGYASTIDSDPVHIYKLLIAYMETAGVVARNTVLSLLGHDQYRRSYSGLIAFKSDNEYMGRLSRPSDEDQFLKSLDFTPKMKKSHVVKVFKSFGHLVKEYKNEYLEIERNKIVNSLYWYFESMKAHPGSFKTLMSTAMFDSFFEIDNGKETKAKVISGYITGGMDAKDKAASRILELYTKRNEITHGKVQLLELDRKSRSSNRQINYLGIYACYREFLSAKVAKLLA